MFRTFGALLALLLILAVDLFSQDVQQSVKIGVVGLSHSHVHGILRRLEKGDIKIVGIAEADRDLAKRYSKNYGFSMDIVYDTIEEMLDKTNPTAVTAFNAIDEHLLAVQACAPRGVHVMVEKPLAANLDHARQMETLAKKHDILLLTNYETTWYASNHKCYDMAQKGALGELCKIVVHDGHEGPKEIGVNKEFLDWLTDPVKNGGGAVTDFGCYGANLITWLMNGEKPLAVAAIMQTNKPDVYPKVDDEATILLKYPKAQGVIQASWNWPFSRKDMQVYGKTGYVFADNSTDIRIRLEGDKKEKTEKLKRRTAPENDPFSYLAAMINGTITPQPYDLSSLENNMIVMQILDAAIRSAVEKRTVELR